jgi:SpoVK/Ycf46/Vps4 family AAA+-type ATPase
MTRFQDPADVELVRAHSSAMLEQLYIKLLLSNDSNDGAEGTLQAQLEVATKKREDLEKQAAAANLTLPTQLLSAAYQLDPFESELIELAVAPQLDPELRQLVINLHQHPAADEIDSALCLRLLCHSREEVLAALPHLAPDAKLFELGLLRRARRDNSSLNAMRLTLSPVGHLCALYAGHRSPSEELAPFARIIEAPARFDAIADGPRLARTLLPIVQGYLERKLEHSTLHPRGLALMLTGAEGSGRSLAAQAVAAELERPVLVLEGSRLMHAPFDLATQALRLLCQEAALYQELALLRDADWLISANSALATALAEALQQFPCILFITAATGATLAPKLEQVVLRQHSIKPSQDVASIMARWRFNQPAGLTFDDGALQHVAERVDLAPAQIRKAVQLAYLTAEATADNVEEQDKRPIDREQDERPADKKLGEQDERPIDKIDKKASAELLEQSAKAQVCTAMGSLTDVAESRVRMRDLILAPETEDKVREIIAAVNNRRKVLDGWGLREHIRRGYGIVCLFDGDPGTGKTLAAEVVANEVGLTLLRVNVSSIVDKYIGETEKNLTRIFEQVRADVNLLLFDEADSLFSKRTEVSRSTDRYSNMEINVLLQLIENYDGVTILTTNLKKAIDSAFERRIAFKVNFPMSEAPERARIWQHFLPPSVPTAEAIDYEALAMMELSGGEIKNAVLRAAYAAAQRAALIDMDYLFDAGRAEAAASGRLVRDVW